MPLLFFILTIQNIMTNQEALAYQHTHQDCLDRLQSVLPGMDITAGLAQIISLLATINLVFHWDKVEPTNEDDITIFYGWIPDRTNPRKDISNSIGSSPMHAALICILDCYDLQQTIINKRRKKAMTSFHQKMADAFREEGLTERAEEVLKHAKEHGHDIK